MRKTKKFDCVEMKNQIQSEMMKECEGLSEAEILERRRIQMETSDDPLAKKWRQLGAKGMSTPKVVTP